MNILRLALIVLSLATQSENALPNPNKPTHLRCEYLENPQGIDIPTPRLFWEDQSDVRGFLQSGYEIELKIGGQVLWDSAKVNSNETVQTEYAGPALESDACYAWRVRVWDQQGDASPWSDEATFSTAYFQAADWRARWIARRPEEEWRARYQASRAAQAQSGRTWGDCRDPIAWIESNPKPYPPAPQFRKEFTVDKPVKQALLHLTGLGYYKLFLNGKQIDGGALAPGVTDYQKRVLYNTYDLSQLLREGKNCLGLIVGRGWYNELCPDIWGFWNAPWVAEPKAIAQLRVVYEDRTQKLIVTDGTWKTTDGPIIFDDLRIGDVYDATRDTPGWCEAGFDDSSWSNVAAVQGPIGDLKSELMEPIQPNSNFSPTSLNAIHASASVDVTAKLKQLVKSNGLSVLVNNNLCATDPAPGEVKTLKLNYRLDGQELTVVGNENSRIELPAKAGNLQIRNAIYGQTDGPAWLFSFPRNIACQMQLKFDGTGMRGKKLRFTFYDYQDSAGHLFTPSGPSYSYYIGRGQNRETIRLPQFGYAGGRYVTVEGLEKKPSINDMTLIEIRSGVNDAGTLETSDPLLNRLHKNIRYTQASDLHSYPQDCWTREKLGWTGDAHVSAEEAIFNFGMGAFDQKWMHDVLDIQSVDGGVNAVVPNYAVGNEGLTWSGVGILIPWQMYRYYGDKRILGEMYQSGSKYLGSIQAMDGHPDIYPGGPAEWCVPWAKTVDQIDHQPDESMASVQSRAVPYSTFPSGGEGSYVYGTAYYYRLATILENTANILGIPDVARDWQKRRNQVRTEFNNEFLDPKAQIYHGENVTGYKQAANVIPLWVGLVPDDVREAVINNLVGDIVARQDGHLNTGVIGTQALFEELPLLGKAELAYRVAMQKTYPGYLWPILNFGETGLPEHWEGGGTHEHIMFGSVDAFFYKWLGGIQPDDESPGFKHFFVRPSIDNPLLFVKTSYRSIRGLIRSEWRKKGSTLFLDVEVPANTEADIDVPKFGYDNPQIEESGAPVWAKGKRAGSSDGISRAADRTNCVQFRVSGGTFHFGVTSSEPLALARNAGIELQSPSRTEVFPAEPSEINVHAVGALSGEAKLAATSSDGARILHVERTGPTSWIVHVVASVGAAWQAESVNLELTGVASGRKVEARSISHLAVDAPVEICYPQPELHVVAGYEQPQSIFYLRSWLPGQQLLLLQNSAPRGWEIQFVVNGRALASGESIMLNHKVFTPVAVILRVPPDLQPGHQETIFSFLVLKGKTVGNIQTVATSLKGPIAHSFKDDFKKFTWSVNGSLKVEPKVGGGAVLSDREGQADPIISDWIVMDLSKPLQVCVKTSEVKGAWCLQLDDGKNIHYLIGDNSQVGRSTHDLAVAKLDGPQRFRLRLFGIGRGGDCRISLDEISISPKP